MPAFMASVKPSHVICVMGFWCFFVFNALRLNISLAIVAMVNWTAIRERFNASKKPECFYNETVVVMDNEDGEFMWDPDVQALVLSSYFWGLALTQLMGGRLAEIFSAKMVILCGTFVAALVTALTPVAAKYNVYSVVTLQIIKGCGQGILVPAFSVMIGRWIPGAERSMSMAYIMSGMPIGGFVTILISGSLCKSSFLGGWPSVFYVFAIFTFVWCILWYMLIYDSPLDHPYITHEELNRIMSLRSQLHPHMKRPIPWKEVMRSGPMWAYISVGFATFWTISLYNIVLPTYLGTILMFQIEMNGIMSSFPNILQAFTMIVASLLAKWCIVKKGYGINPVRKTAIISGLIGFTVFMVGVTFAGCNRWLNVIFLVMALGMSGINFSAVNMVSVDMTPKFAGTVSGLMSTLGALSGVMIPELIGFLTEDVQTLKEWHQVFYFSGALSIFAVVIFLIFGSCEVQPWNDPPGDAQVLSEDITEEELNE